jgi:hypothetical protein
MSESQRSLRGVNAVNKSWAHTEDRTKRTQAGRDAFDKRFDDEVDPERKLDPAERAKRAANARKAYFAALAYKSSRARQARAAARKAGAQ